MHAASHRWVRLLCPLSPCLPPSPVESSSNGWYHQPRLHQEMALPQPTHHNPLTASPRQLQPNPPQKPPPLPLHLPNPYPKIHHPSQVLPSQPRPKHLPSLLRKISPNHPLPLSRELPQQRRDIGAGALEQHLGRGDHARGVLPAQGLCLEGLGDEDEDSLGLGLGGYCGVLSFFRLLVLFMRERERREEGVRVEGVVKREGVEGWEVERWMVEMGGGGRLRRGGGRQ